MRMIPEQWQKLGPLLDQLLDLTAGGQAHFLQQLRTKDPHLCQAVQELLEQEPVTRLDLRSSPPATFQAADIAWCDRIEAAWQAWQPASGAPPPRWDTYLPSPDQTCDPGLVFFLLQIDIERRVKAGLTALLAERYFEHPSVQLGPAQQLELIRWEYQLRWKHGDRARAADYQAAFPHHAEALRDLRPRDTCPRCQHVVVLEDEAAEVVCCTYCATTFPLAEVFRPGGPIAAAGKTTAKLPHVPGYEILEELGRGGMGVVYKARHVRLNRLVALKMVLAGSQAGSEERLRFLAEAEAVAALQHPNIVQVFDVGQHDGLPYMALEFVPGGSLSSQLQAGLPQPRETARLLEQLAQGMAAAHTRGIIHRDLKPANILLQKEEGRRMKDESNSDTPSDSSFILPPSSFVPKITDFGLARKVEGGSGLTQTGAVLGTPSYMAPEQAAGKVRDIGAAVDVYALGAILYECLTGRPPFRGVTPLDTLQQVTASEPVPPARLQPKVPRDLETICLKCLQKEPHKRYGSAAELAEDLRRFLAHEPIRARRIGPFGRLARWCRRQPALAATLACAGLLLVTVAGIGAWRVLEERGRVFEERDRYMQERDRAEANLYRALLDEARAQMEARQTGWWWKAMENIRQAGQLQAENRNPTELRELAIECMGTANPCMRLHPRWDAPPSPASSVSGPVNSVAISPDQRLAASGSGDGTVRLWSLPDGRMLRALHGHRGEVTEVAFDPEGRQVVSSSRDGSLRLWDLGPLHRPGTEDLPVRVMDLRSGSLFTVAFSPDGQWLAAGCADGTARLLPVAAGKSAEVLNERKLAGHSKAVTCLAFALTAPQLITGSADSTLRFWDLTTDKCMTCRPVHEAATSLAFSPDGRKLAWSDAPSFGFAVLDLSSNLLLYQPHLHASSVTQVAFASQQRVISACQDGTVKLWRQAGATGFVELVGGHCQGAGALSVCLSRDEKWVVAGYADGRVRLWELFEPPARAILPHTDQNAVFLGHGRRLAKTGVVYDLSAGLQATGTAFSAPAVGALAVHPHDSRLVLGTEQGGLCIWDSSRSQPLVEWTGHRQRITSLASSPDGHRLASASADGAVKLWQWDTGRLDRSLTPGLGPIHAIAWSSDGRYLAATAAQGVVVCDLSRDAAPQVLSEHSLPASGVALAGNLLACCGPQDHSVEIRQVGSGEKLHTLHGHTGAVCAVGFSPDGRWLATAAADATIQLWDPATGKKGQTLALPGPGLQPHWLAFGPRGRFLAVGTNNGTTLYDLRSPATTPLARANPALAGQFTADGSALLLGTSAGAVCLGKVAEIEAKRAQIKAPVLAHPLRIEFMEVLVPGGHVSAVWGMAASRDGRWLASASHDQTVKLWDGRTMKLIRTLAGHREPLWSIAVSADGKYVASGSFRGVVKVWEAATGEEVKLQGKGHTRLISALIFHPTRPWLVSGSDDGSVRLWDVAAGKELGVLHQFSSEGVHKLAFRPDGRWLAASCTDQTIALWDFSSEPALPTPPNRQLRGHTSGVWGLAFSADGRTLASGSDQGVIILWDGTTFEPLVTLRGGTRQIRDLSFSADGQLLAGAAYAGPTIVWDLAALRRGLGEMNLDWEGH
jgi:WD40 repeat protein